MNESLSGLHLRLMLVLGAVIPAWSGCAWHAPAASDRQLVETAMVANAGDWPARAKDKLSEIIRIAPEVLSVRVKHDTLVGGRIVKSPKRLPAADERFSGLYGRGIIRHFKDDPAD